MAPSSTSGGRAVPTQARAARTVDGLLDAAAAVIDEVGYDQATTALVASRAGVSIGLLYRYFPDKLAVATALVARNRDRFGAALVDRLDDPAVTTWRESFHAIVDLLVHLHDTEPGFTAVGFADQFLAGQGVAAEVDNTALAEGFLAIYLERYVPPGPRRRSDDELRLHLVVGVEVVNALLNRAIRLGPPERDQLLAEARRLVVPYFAEVLDAP